MNPQENYFRLPLENAVNVRDLGGLPAAGGKPTKFKAFVRSGHLSDIKDCEIQFLLDYGVKTVVDLRTAGEAVRYPNPFSRVFKNDYFNISLMSKNVTFPDNDFSKDPMGEFYISIIDNAHECVRKIMQTIARARDGGVLFHCFAGKDRTGIIAYIILSLAGVCREDIIANYKISDTYFVPYAKRTYNDFHGEPIYHFLSLETTVENLMNHVDVKYGGVKDYLLKIGITADEMEKIVRRTV